MATSYSKTESAPRLVSSGEAARILGVSIYTIHRWDKAGSLNSIRTVGNARRFYVSELEALLESKAS